MLLLVQLTAATQTQTLRLVLQLRQQLLKKKRRKKSLTLQLALPTTNQLIEKNKTTLMGRFIFDMTPEIRTLISGVIFMAKYTKEIKLAIYHEWVDDHRRGTYLSRKYGMGYGGIQYLVDLIQKHGEDILDRSQQKYTVDFKLAAIDRVLLGGEALRQVSLDLGLTNTGILAR